MGVVQDVGASGAPRLRAGQVAPGGPKRAGWRGRGDFGGVPPPRRVRRRASPRLGDRRRHGAEIDAGPIAKWPARLGCSRPPGPPVVESGTVSARNPPVPGPSVAASKSTTAPNLPEPRMKASNAFRFSSCPAKPCAGLVLPSAETMVAPLTRAPGSRREAGRPRRASPACTASWKALPLRLKSLMPSSQTTVETPNRLPSLAAPCGTPGAAATVAPLRRCHESCARMALAATRRALIP